MSNTFDVDMAEAEWRSNVPSRTRYAVFQSAITEIERLKGENSDLSAEASGLRAYKKLITASFTAAAEKRDELQAEVERLTGLDDMNEQNAFAAGQIHAEKMKTLKARVAELEGACRQARGAIIVDAMVDDDGNQYGTTTEALKAISSVLDP